MCANKVTFQDVMNSDSWPKCEHCQLKPAVATVQSPGLHDELPSYGIPPWCQTCLDTVSWSEYWLTQARQDYQTGTKQS